MEQRIKKYLKEELKNACEYLKSEKELLKEIEDIAYKNEEILTTLKKSKNGKKEIIKTIKSLGEIPLLGFILGVLTNVLGLSAFVIISFIILELIMSVNLVIEITNYKKYNNKIKNLSDDELHNIREIGEDKTPALEYILKDQKEQISEINDGIKSYNEYIFMLIDILNSEDYLDKLIEYQKKNGFFTTILTREWEEYLSEISSIPPYEYSLSTEELKNVEPIKLSKH